MSVKTKIIGTILLIVVMLILGLHVMAPYLLRKKLNAYVKENCVSCLLEIGTVKTDILFSNLRFEDVHFSWGDPKATAVDIQIPLLKMNMVISGLFRHIIHLEHIIIKEPKVKVLEGDLKSESSNSKTNGAQFVIDGIEILQAHFTYTRESNGRFAPIHVGQIQAQIDQIGNTLDSIDHRTTGEVNAVLEDSGKINLKVSTYLFQKALNVDVDLKLNEQSLQRMNPYFETNDGIRLTGQLFEGHSGVSIKEQQLYAYVQAQYEGLDIQFKKTGRRTALSAFFSNLIGGLKLKTKNTGVKQREQIQYINIKREPDETIFTFIFRGMKEASLKVATTSN